MLTFDPLITRNWVLGFFFFIFLPFVVLALIVSPKNKKEVRGKGKTKKSSPAKNQSTTSPSSSGGVASTSCSYVSHSINKPAGATTTLREQSLDITPLSLGFGDSNGDYHIAITKNTPIPCMKEVQFKVPCHNYIDMVFSIYQGEKDEANENFLLRVFRLTTLSPDLVGQTVVKLRFEIGRDGILYVSAKDQTTGCDSEITVKNWGSQSRVNLRERNDLRRYANDLKTRIDRDKVASKLSYNMKMKIKDAIDKTTSWLDETEQQSGRTNDGAREMLQMLLELIWELVNEKQSKRGRSYMGVEAWVKKNGWEIGLEALGMGVDAALAGFMIPIPLGTAIAKIIKSFRKEK